MSGRPSDQVAAVIAGKVDLADAAPAIQSWASYYIHQMACHVLEGETKADRAARLAAYPKLLQPMIQKEAYRVWQRRT